MCMPRTFRPITFKYKDSSGTIYGPLTLNTELNKERNRYEYHNQLIELYEQKRLRRNHQIDLSDSNLYNFNLSNWIFLQPYVDHEWQIKIDSLYKNDDILCNFCIFCLWSFLFIVAVFAIIIWVIYTIIWHLSGNNINSIISIQPGLYTIPCILAFKLLHAILRYGYLRICYKEPTLDKSFIISIATLKVSHFVRNKEILVTHFLRRYQARRICICLTFMISATIVISLVVKQLCCDHKWHSLKLLQSVVVHLFKRNGKIFAIMVVLVSVMVSWFSICYFPAIMAYALLFGVVSIARYQMLWVLPEMYDIQDDLTYFIVQPLQKYEGLIDKKDTYHILNAVASACIDKYYPLDSKEEQKRFYDELQIKSCVQTTETYLSCIEQQLNTQISNLSNIYTCDHKFDFSNGCESHYHTYQSAFYGNLKDNNIVVFILTMWGEVRLLFSFLISMYILVLNSNWNEISDCIVCNLYIGGLVIFGFVFINYIYCSISFWLTRHYADYKEITKGIEFWMSPDTLVHIRNNDAKQDKFVAALMDISTECIAEYLNTMYYVKVMQDVEDNYWPPEITIVLLGYLSDVNCVRNCINEFLAMNDGYDNFTYDVDNISNKITQTISNSIQVKYCNIFQTTSQNECVKIATNQDVVSAHTPLLT